MRRRIGRVFEHSGTLELLIHPLQHAVIVTLLLHQVEVLAFVAPINATVHVERVPPLIHVNI